MQRVKQLLDYMHSNPFVKIRFRASDMILNIHSDASYLTATKGQSRAGGYFFLGSLPKEGNPIKLNGNITITCAILKLVAASGHSPSWERWRQQEQVHHSDPEPVENPIDDLKWDQRQDHTEPYDFWFSTWVQDKFDWDELGAYFAHGVGSVVDERPLSFKAEQPWMHQAYESV